MGCLGVSLDVTVWLPSAWIGHWLWIAACMSSPPVPADVHKCVGTRITLPTMTVCLFKSGARLIQGHFGKRHQGKGLSAIRYSSQ